MEHKIHDLHSGIKIQEYNNGSYGFWVEGKGWRNIPKQLGETLVKKFSIPIVVKLKGTFCGCGKPYSQKDLEDGLCHKCCAPTGYS